MRAFWSSATVYGGALPAKNLSMTGQPPSSTLTATSWNFFGSIALASCRSEGSSPRHGGHQVAQKFSSTTLPRYADRSICLPSRAGSENGTAAAGGISSAFMALAARAPWAAKCWTNLLAATATTATTAKATNTSLSQRGTTQVRRAAFGMLE